MTILYEYIMKMIISKGAGFVVGFFFLKKKERKSNLSMRPPFI